MYELPLEAVKKPHQKQNFTDRQAQELIECTSDPLYFLKNYMRIQHALKGSLQFEPYPFQEEMIRSFHENRFCIALTARQMGKALALDTPIPTPTGWTTMGDIAVGDRVLGPDGKPVLVSFVTDPMIGHDCYDVEFDNGEIITADAEHLWQIGGSLWRDKEPRQMTTRELLPWLEKAKAQGQSLFIATSDPLVLDDVELPVAPYTLGVWLGDGNSGDGRFCGHADDSDEMRGFVMADGYELSAKKADPRNNVRYQTIYGIRGKLVEANVLKNKHIPDIYLRSSARQRLELLQGLMDTDGHAASTGGFDFYQKDKILAEQVFELIASLGMKPRLKQKIVNGELYWKVRFATTRMNVFKLARKQAVADRMTGHPKNHRFFFKTIKPVASVPVKCIRVENESHLFLAGKSMIPTHNTTSAAGYLLWKAMFNPDTRILIVANNFAGALEIMDRVRYAYETTPDFLRAGAVEYNKGQITFDNGSRITSRATSPNAARGLSITLLYIDEFAFVAPNLAEHFWTSVRPTLATGGSCIITSTPKSDADQFATIWQGAIDQVDKNGNPTGRGIGNNDFKPIKVTFEKHPERGKGSGFEETERASIGNQKFLQEYCCEFVTDDLTLIDPLFLSEMQSSDVEFYTAVARWYKEPEANKTYLVGLDPSMGTGGDPSAIQVFELPGMVQVAEWSNNRYQMKDQVALLKHILHFIDDELRSLPNQRGEPQIYWTVENNSWGMACIEIISHTGEDKFPGMFVSEKRKKGQKRILKGLNTSVSTKKAACVRFKSLMETRRMVINSENLIRELKVFVTGDSGSAKAKPGKHDDLVMATLLCVRMLEQVTAWDDSFEELKEIILEDDDLSGPAAFVM